MQTTRRDSAIPPTTFTCERCLTTFNTREELRNHSINVHSTAKDSMARRSVRMPERNAMIVAAAITGGALAASLIMFYYLRRRKSGSAIR